LQSITDTPIINIHNRNALLQVSNTMTQTSEEDGTKTEEFITLSQKKKQH